MSPLEILELPVPAVDSLWECITMIEAQTQLNNLTVATFSKKKDSDRSKIHKEILYKAYPDLAEKKVSVVTQSDLNRVLGLKRG